MDITQLREMVLSNDYVDLIRNFQTSPRPLRPCSRIWAHSFLAGDMAWFMWSVLYIMRSLSISQAMPVFQSCLPPWIPPAWRYPESYESRPSLCWISGEGVIIGFIDTGINYTLPAFQTSDGRSRILRLWDQTIQSDDYPPGIFYGTEYTQEMLTEALGRENPLEYVPSVDTDGHGTSVAAIAAGSEDPANNFIGAAPRCDIAVVKLKPAKEYLKDFFRFPKVH